MGMTKTTEIKTVIEEKEVEETIYTRTCDWCGKVIFKSTSFPYDYYDVSDKYYINIPEEKEDKIKAFCCKECFQRYVWRNI